MPSKTCFFVQAFGRDDDGKLYPEEARSAPNRQVALSLGAVLARKQAGAVVLSKTSDPSLGKFDAPVVIRRFGDTPHDLWAHPRKR